MSLILITHETDEPALYGGLAAAVAGRLAANFAHLPARFDTARFADAVQHATADGGLVGSGLLWHERLTTLAVGRETTMEAVLAAAMERDMVVPLHPAFAEGLRSELEMRAASTGVAVRHYDVAEDRAAFVLTMAGVADARLGSWRRDSFGRLEDGGRPAALKGDGPPLRIALVGTERDHRKAYPAVLAALGDAADALSLALDIAFVDPPSLQAADVPEILATVDGILLPGGADMINVPGQILMARGALDAKTPVLGLCLGMQTMATAVAQKVLGTDQVNLAEADPKAEIKSFIAMAGSPGLPDHRLGERSLRIEASSCLMDRLGGSSPLRYNHRFRFNPALLPAVARGGLRVGAWDETRQIVDAIEVENHPFYIGLQGHPELSSRAGHPHPVLSRFLEHCKVGRVLSFPGTGTVARLDARRMGF